MDHEIATKYSVLGRTPLEEKNRCFVFTPIFAGSSRFRDGVSLGPPHEKRHSFFADRLPIAFRTESNLSNSPRRGRVRDPWPSWWEELLRA